MAIEANPVPGSGFQLPLLGRSGTALFKRPSPRLCCALAIPTTPTALAWLRVDALELAAAAPATAGGGDELYEGLSPRHACLPSADFQAPHPNLLVLALPWPKTAGLAGIAYRFCVGARKVVDRPQPVSPGPYDINKLCGQRPPGALADQAFTDA